MVAALLVHNTGIGAAYVGIVRSLRTGDFDLYVDTLTKLTPWFFSLNHTHYARWMSVHVRDMCILDATHPDVAQEFRNGKFIWPSLKENSPRSPLTVELLD